MHGRRPRHRRRKCSASKTQRQRPCGCGEACGAAGAAGSGAVRGAAFRAACGAARRLRGLHAVWPCWHTLGGRASSHCTVERPRQRRRGLRGNLGLVGTSVDLPPGALDIIVGSVRGVHGRRPRNQLTRLRGQQLLHVEPSAERRAESAWHRAVQPADKRCFGLDQHRAFEPTFECRIKHD